MDFRFLWLIRKRFRVIRFHTPWEKIHHRNTHAKHAEYHTYIKQRRQPATQGVTNYNPISTPIQPPSKIDSSLGLTGAGMSGGCGHHV